MLDKLSSTLKKATDKITNAVFLDKSLVDSIVKDLQRALIEADVNVPLVLQITQKIKKAALDEKIKGIEKKEHIIKLLHDELIAILGQSRTLELGKENRWLLVGLYGAGKTTTIAKLASYYKKRGSKVAAIGLDVHRPAAPQQLKQNCDALEVACFIDPEEKDPKKIWKKFEKDLKSYDLILVDSAGRDSLDSDLIKEIEAINSLVKPTETFLTLQADIGQTAKKQAEAFKNSLNISGVIITKMDSTAKAGGALTACAESGAPVVFIGTGEKPSDLETFDPESFLSRLLGMGDLKTLMEKIHSVVDQKQVKKSQQELEEGKISLETVIEQMKSMDQLGGLSKLKGLIPGMNKIPEGAETQLEQAQEKTKRWEYIVSSMTPYEKENPEVLEKQTSRIQRIAKGSGTTTSEIRALLKQYKMLNELVKSQSQLASGQLDQKTMMKLAKKFGKKKMRF